MIGQTVSHYRVISKLGEGGMGTVYLAEDTVLGRRVAIKSLTIAPIPGQRHFRTRFLREARAASLLNHPHIATVYDYGETEDGQPYLVMELIDGETLNDLLKRESPSPERAIAIIKQVTEAIAEAHRHGIVHRDIKPSNVALNQRNDVKVLDFGLAKHFETEGLQTRKFGDDAELVVTQTLDGVVVGTPLYLSPEQALGVPVDKRSDLFSIGALLYECLTCRPAFFGKSLGEIFAHIIRDDPLPPSKLNPRVPLELDRITLKALAKKPEDRYQTAEELLADLKHADSQAAEDVTRSLGQPISARLRSSIPRLLSFKRATVFLSLALVVALFALWFTVGRWTTSGPSPEAKRLYQAGTDALRNGSYLKANELFEQAVKTDPAFPLAHARLAEVWMDLDYEEKATNELVRVTELAPNLSSLPPIDMLQLQAISATVRRNYTGAVQNYEAIVQQLPEAEKGSAYFDLGRAYERAGDTSKAITAFEEVTRRDSQSAAGFLRLGSLYGRRQEEAKSATAFENAQKLFDAQRNDEGRAEVFYQRGAVYSVVDKLAEAQEQFRRALDLAMTTNNKSQQIKTMLQLGAIFYNMGETSRAEPYLKQAMELARAEQLDNLTTTGLIEIGYAFFLRGDHAEAEKYFQQSLQIARANKGRRGEARALVSLGSLFVQQSDGGKALQYLEPALAFYRQGDFRRETSQALLLLGYANEQQGNNEAAYESLKEQLQLATEINDTAQLAHTHAAIGLLLAHQERFTEALNHFDESYKLNKSLGLTPKTGYDLVNRGNLLWQLGHYKEAGEALDQAFEVASRMGGVDKQLLGWIHLVKARMALSESRYGETLAESRKALALGGTQDKDFSVQLSITQGLAQLNSGTPRAGMMECQKALDIATPVGDPRLISTAQLAVAEVLLASGDAANALTAALQAQQTLARLGSRHSEWRAWLVAAQSSHRQQDTLKVDEYASQAAGLLTALERTFGANEYSSYLSRPDVRKYRKQLEELLPGTNN